MEQIKRNGLQKKWSSHLKAQAVEVLAVVEQEKEPEVEVPAVIQNRFRVLAQRKRNRNGGWRKSGSGSSSGVKYSGGSAIRN